MVLRKLKFREGMRGSVCDVWAIVEGDDPHDDEAPIILTLTHYVEYPFDEVPLEIVLSHHVKANIQVFGIANISEYGEE